MIPSRHGWSGATTGSRSCSCAGRSTSSADSELPGWPARARDALQFGCSLVVWGAALRTVYLWHTTWAVNSVSHMWGYRNYDTPDDSRNNAIVALLGGGGGWHNNHHADPASARHGHKWWEFDLSWLTIRLLARLGLATKVALPSPRLTTPSNPHTAPTDARVG